MKALFLSAAMAIASMSCFAQASDHSNVHIGLLLDNVIEIDPPADAMGAYFHTGFDYTNGLELTDIHGGHTSDFFVSSNRNFNVTIKSASPNFLYIGFGTGNTVMPCSVLQYNLFTNGTGGTNATPAPWNTLTVAAAPLINNGVYGPHKPFSLRFRADPGWSYSAGLYGIDVVLTATQL
ncbi:hypothetical protein ACDQ55_17450 [Chitinophaga sp. 30R24]|uniref:hypothetical protein n=1 Tax=Chitinophaga sp. 30R24 TaxID=3248838 RepID=UPI003B8F9E13